MDRFNRLVVVTLLLLALPVCTVTLAIPGEVARFVDWLGAVLGAWVGGPGVSLLEAAQDISLAGRLGLAVLAVFVDLLIGIILFFQLRRPKGEFTVRARGSVADVSPESIQAQVMHHVGEVSDVLDLDVNVRPQAGGRVELTLDVLIGPDVPLAKKVREVTQVARKVVVKRMGLRLASAPVVHVELASPSAIAHAREMISSPVPLATPDQPVAALSEPETPPPAAEDASPVGEGVAGAADVGEMLAPAGSGQDLDAGRERPLAD